MDPLSYGGTQNHFNRPPWVSGSTCTYHPAAPGLNPKYNIDAFIILYLNCDVKRTKLNIKIGRERPIFNKYSSTNHICIFCPFLCTKTSLCDEIKNCPQWGSNPHTHITYVHTFRAEWDIPLPSSDPYLLFTALDGPWWAVWPDLAKFHHFGATI